jgi:hypothetical protein
MEIVWTTEFPRFLVPMPLSHLSFLDFYASFVDYSVTLQINIEHRMRGEILRNAATPTRNLFDKA